MKVYEARALEVVANDGKFGWVVACELLEAADAEQQILKRVPCPVLQELRSNLVFNLSFTQNSAAALYGVES